MLDCFVPRNDDARCRHCEERSNPFKISVFDDYKRGLFISLLAILLFPSSCVLPFEPQIVEDTSGILVVEGMILETGTTIKLSRTVRIDNDSDGESNTGLEDVHNARIRVIDDKNNVVVAEQQFIEGKINPGIYVVTDEISFAPGTKYALNIQIGEKQYQSLFVSPVMNAPEIDKITWKQNADRSMDIMVSTHDPENKIEYYLWSFEEDWEIWAAQFGTHRYEPTTKKVIEQSVFTANNRFYCWDSNKSKSLIVGTSDKLTEATIKNRVIHSFQKNNTRFSYLYSFLVKQYAINREAYLYFDNLRKNIELSGSVFAPILSELKGNITCLSNTDETVIGYICATKEVSKRIYIDMEKLEGEDSYNCYPERDKFGMIIGDQKTAYRAWELEDAFAAGMGIFFVDPMTGIYHHLVMRCVDCTLRGGTKNKPDFWPNDHL